MKTAFSLSLITGANALVSNTQKKTMAMVYEELHAKYPNATIMLRKKGHGDDAWEDYQNNKQRKMQDPAAGYVMSEPSLAPGSLDGLGGKSLLPPTIGKFAKTMEGSCNKMKPAGKSYHGSLAEPYHSDFMQGWGLTAVIEQTYGHLIISDDLIEITEACTNVRKQVALYGVAEAQCCSAATDLCCAAHYNYESFRHQAGARYAYVCQGLTDFPYGKVEVTKEQCVKPFAKAEWQTAAGDHDYSVGKGKAAKASPSQ
jgi:hypothetical protein